MSRKDVSGNLQNTYEFKFSAPHKVQHKDLIFQTPENFVLFPIQNATVTETGMIYNFTARYTFGYWYFKKDADKLVASSANSKFEPGTFVSFMMIWQDAFQHNSFDTYPRAQYACSYLKRHVYLRVVVTCELQRDIFIEACTLNHDRFKIYNGPFSAKTIYAAVYATPTLMGIIPSASIKSLGSQLQRGGRVIYMPRQAGQKRSVSNEDEVIDLLQVRYGSKLDVFRPTNDWRKDRSAFAQAGLVIGPHGGAFGNMIFCPLRTIIVEFLPILRLSQSEKNPRPCYMGLAKGLDFEYHALEVVDFSFDTPMLVSLTALADLLDQIKGFSTP